MLFHVSEEFGIERFEPRLSQYAEEPVVWAISDKRLHNYLVPRDCPRVTYYSGSETNASDVERFLGSSPAVVAIESGGSNVCVRAGCTVTTCHLKRSSVSMSAPAIL